MTGFSVTSTTYFQILISAQVVSTVNYLIRVDTQSDCLILRIDINVVFCDNQALTNKNYLYQGGQSIMVSANADVNSVSYTTTVTNYSSTVFLMGMRGLNGFTILNNATWGWSILNISSNSIVTINVDKYQLQYIYFSFFQIGIYTTTTDPTTPTIPPAIPPTTPTI